MKTKTLYIGVLLLICVIFASTTLSACKSLPTTSQVSIEQLICSLSSILVVKNGQFNVALNPAQESLKTPPTEPDDLSIQILSDSWGIYDHETLIDTINDLEAGGHARSYKETLAISDKYPDLSVLDVSTKECLTVLQTTRLFFVRYFKDILGEHGIEAWDKGRELNLLRWGIAAQYISEEEALEIMSPIALKLQQDYATWEDFASHYVIGREFFALSFGEYSAYTYEALEDIKNAIDLYQVNSIPMYGDTSGKNKVLTLDDVWYRPTLEAQMFDKLLEISDDSPSENNLPYLKVCLEKFPNVPCVQVLNIYVSSTCLPPTKVYPLIKQAESLILSCTVKTEVYNQYFSLYAIIMNNLGRSDEALSALSQLSDEAKEFNWYFFLTGMAYANLVGTSPDYEQNEAYFNIAIENFVLAQQKGYELPESVYDWLNECTSEE